jgi:hypothetical protein
MAKVIFSFIILLAAAATASSSNCHCRVAADEHPVLGNVAARANGGTVRVVRGKVVYPNGNVAKDAIVEVFENSLQTGDWQTDDYLKIETRQRKVACLTDRNGMFCVPRLAPGRYLLRIGMRGPDQGIGAVRMFVIVKRNGRAKLPPAYLAQSI